MTELPPLKVYPFPKLCQCIWENFKKIYLKRNLGKEPLSYKRIMKARISFDVIARPGSGLASLPGRIRLGVIARPGSGWALLPGPDQFVRYCPGLIRLGVIAWPG